jgi:hypothetical protein
MRGRCLFSVDLRVGLDPLSNLIVGNLEIVVFVESRDNVDADDAIVGVVLGVGFHPEVHID